MSIAAIIAEYNPMHKGHEYLINKAKSITGADQVIVVMSGDFVQRGTPAVMNKYMRTELALMGGADIVLELPSYYATSSAEFFANGAVSLIDSLRVVDYLCFGVECDDIELLYELAEVSVFNEKEYNMLISKYVEEGISYAKAESMAIIDIIKDYDDAAEKRCLTYDIDELDSILSSPNNTLAISYIRALLILDSNIEPVGIKRITSGYNDDSIGALSSSAVRKELIDGNYPPLKEQLSREMYEYIRSSVGTDYPISIDDYSDILIYKLMDIVYGSGNNLKASGILKLSEYVDVSESLAARIINNLNDFESFSQFITILKTKDTTYTRISRALMHIILNIKKSNMHKYVYNDMSLYARILGFRRESTDVLSLIKEYSIIPIVSKLADAGNVIDNELTKKLLNENTYASELYSHIASQKYGAEFIPEYSHPIIIW